MKINEFIKYTGLWTVPVITLAVVGTCCALHINILIQDIVTIVICTLPVTLYIWSSNMVAKANDIPSFPLFPSKYITNTNPYYQVTNRYKNINRNVPCELIGKSPEGIILGKSGNTGKYIRLLPSNGEANHCLVLGGSGSGKTSGVLLSTIIAAQVTPEDSPTFVYIDVKGELTKKGFINPNKKLAVFNPRDRSGYGFDFLYGLNENSTENDIYTVMKRLVYALVPVKNSNTDTFWTDAPRNVILALFIHGYQYMKLNNIVDLVDYTLSKNIIELIPRVVSETQTNSIVYKLLTPFLTGEGDASETLSSISMTIINALSLLASDENLRFLLREKEEKITPDFPDKGISVALQINDADIEIYASLLNMILSAFNYQFSQRDENSRSVILLIDELSRICCALHSPIDGLQSLLQIGRSRGVSVLLATQSIDALEDAYSKGALQDMLCNITYRCILQCRPDDKSTVDMIINSFGKYDETKKSVSVGKTSSNSYSFEEKDIIKASDLLALPKEHRVIIIAPSGTYIANTCQYFKDKKIKKIQEIWRKK